jgi:hypothetical protein
LDHRKTNLLHLHTCRGASNTWLLRSASWLLLLGACTETTSVEGSAGALKRTEHAAPTQSASAGPRKHVNPLPLPAHGMGAAGRAAPHEMPAQGGNVAGCETTPPKPGGAAAGSGKAGMSGAGQGGVGGSVAVAGRPAAGSGGVGQGGVGGSVAVAGRPAAGSGGVGQGGVGGSVAVAGRPAAGGGGAGTTGGTGASGASASGGQGGFGGSPEAAGAPAAGSGGGGSACAVSVCNDAYPCQQLGTSYTCRGQFPDWEPNFSPAELVLTGKGTVKDTRTGLEWQQYVPSTYGPACSDHYQTTPKVGVSSDACTWSDAKRYCAGLSLDGAGWRLPTRMELESILDNSVESPAIAATAFPGTPADDFWSSSPSYYSPSSIGWKVMFGFGDTLLEIDVMPLRVRCVR